MHQKNNQAAQSSAAASQDNDDDDNPTDPFADTEEDIDDDDDGAQDDRGSWWRGVVRRKGKADGNESDDEANSDDDEFGDFAMAEDDRSGDSDDGKVVLRPLAVNPAKEGSRGLSGLWPFGLSKVEKEKEFLHDDKPGFDDDFTSFDDKPEDEGKRAIEVKEAKRRTSIEDPDDEEVVV